MGELANSAGRRSGSGRRSLSRCVGRCSIGRRTGSVRCRGLRRRRCRCSSSCCRGGRRGRGRGRGGGSGGGRGRLRDGIADRKRFDQRIEAQLLRRSEHDTPCGSGDAGDASPSITSGALSRRADTKELGQEIDCCGDVITKCAQDDRDETGDCDRARWDRKADRAKREHIDGRNVVLVVDEARKVISAINRGVDDVFGRQGRANEIEGAKGAVGEYNIERNGCFGGSAGNVQRRRKCFEIVWGANGRACSSALGACLRDFRVQCVDLDSSRKRVVEGERRCDHVGERSSEQVNRGSDSNDETFADTGQCTGSLDAFQSFNQ